VNDLGGRASAYQGVAFVGGMPNLVARAFKEQGVLRSDVHDGSEWLELAHDALIAPILQVDPAAPREAAPEWEPQEYLALARQALAQGQVARADSYARRVVTDSRGSPATLAEGFALLGRLATLQARTANARAVDDHEAAAENHFQRALELFESGGALHGAASMLRALGELYRDRGRLADALGVLQAAVAHSPGDVTLKVDLARVLSDTGQRPAALSVYREVLAVAEDHPEALVGQATVLATNGDPAAVLADLDRAVRAHPELADRPDVIELRLTARRRLDEGRP
jgi:tetratricopeptide (TPR) repeat protein